MHVWSEDEIQDPTVGSFSFDIKGVPGNTPYAFQIGSPDPTLAYYAQNYDGDDQINSETVGANTAEQLTAELVPGGAPSPGPGKTFADADLDFPGWKHEPQTDPLIDVYTELTTGRTLTIRTDDGDPRNGLTVELLDRDSFVLAAGILWKDPQKPGSYVGGVTRNLQINSVPEAETP